MARPVTTDQVEYEDEWLPRNFRPMTVPQLVWHKLKSMPLVGVGLASVVGSFGMATYWYRMGNPVRFNYWLRWRVLTQFFTFAAMIGYGGVAFTREKQKQVTQQQMVMLGDLPADTKIRKANNNPFAPARPDEWRAAVLNPQAAEEVEMELEQEIPQTDVSHYPKPVSERMTTADFRAKLANRQPPEYDRLRGLVGGDEDFASRLEVAIRKQSEEDEARARGEIRGAQSATGQGELLRRRGREVAHQRDEREKRRLEGPYGGERSRDEQI